MFIEGLTAIFLLCILIQLGYALCFFAQVFRMPSAGYPGVKHKPVSVVICARNEAANLRHNLPVIMGQRYANDVGINLFEVIVVNDASTDETAEVLAHMQKIYPSLVVVTIPGNEQRDVPGKKYALEKGITRAKSDYIITTDADCMPASGLWLAKIADALSEETPIAAGYGKYVSRHGLLNTFIRWETMHTFLQYGSYALAGRPYMATGRNLAYHKGLFAQARQHPAWGNIPSGDDDLLVNAAGSRGRMNLVVDNDACTISEPKTTWSEWGLQKQRHLSTGKYYTAATQFRLGLYAISHALAWTVFVILLITHNWPLALGAMLCRCIIYWVIWNRMACKLHEKGLTRWFPLMDIGWMLYNFAFSPYIFWKNKKQWT